MDYGQFKQNFEAFLDEFYQQKSNSLQFSNSTNPGRLKRVTLNLATASASITGATSAFRKFAIPFRSIHVERIYSTASPSTNKAGQIKLALDYDNINNTSDAYKLLQVNDSFISDQSFAQCFLGWDAQADTSVDIAFMVDMDYRAGGAATAVVGTVSVESAGELAVKEVPADTFTYSVNSNTFLEYTVPAGYYGIACATMNTTAATTCTVAVNGVNLLYSIGIATSQTLSNIYLAEGDVIRATQNAGTGNTSMSIAIFAK